MNPNKRIIMMLIISTIFILIGAWAKTQGWENIKPLMLVGLALQTATLFYALYRIASKKNQ